MVDSYDVVIVGGGIAGSALARSLADAQLRVLVLERTTEFKDRVRGECMMPWGALEARELGVEETLLNCGGGYVTQSVGYDEMVAPSDAEASAVPLGMFVGGIPGMLDVGHPQASEALNRAAVEAGATMVRGTGDVVITAGTNPVVRYEFDGVEHEVRCHLIVGADGRQSVVRKQLGISLQETTPTAMLSGLLVSGFEEWPAETVTLGTEGDVHFLLFPRPGGLVRLYLGYSIDAKDRFTGPDRARRFLEAFRVDSLPYGETIATLEPAGPCAGQPGFDTWTDQSFPEGAVLIGDAAGWSDPLIGQGLSVALRDARSVRDVLLAGDDWSAASFVPYGEERRERMRRERVAAEVMKALRCDFTNTGAARRAAFFGTMMSDPLSAGVMMTMLSGPEVPASDVFERENVERIMAMA